MRTTYPERAIHLLPVLNVIVWVLLPTLLEGSLRLDAAEGFTGGPEWQLSYPKHPPLSEWLTAVAWHAGTARYSALYLISQMLAAGSVYIVARWLLVHAGAAAACVATIAGLASPFATYIPVQLNHNIGVMPFWALVPITAWAAFNTRRLMPWALFGLTVGFGFWAKYSVLHVVAPLGILFLATPEWRKGLAGVGPWLAAVIAIVVSAPHFIDAWNKGAMTLQYAVHPVSMSVREVFGFAFNSTMNSLLLFSFASVPFFAAAGFAPMFRAARQSFAPSTAQLKDKFLAAAAFGPMLLVAISPFFGIRPRPLWITPMIIPVVAWLGYVASKVAVLHLRRAMIAGGVLAALLALGYANTILIPIQNSLPQYSNLDGRKLRNLARDYWKENGTGQIEYIIPTGLKTALHASGSIAFDLSHRVHVFEAADTRLAPWIDPQDVLRRGALVVGSPEIPENFTVAGAKVTRKVTYERPVVRGRKRRPIMFGVIEPR